MKKLLVIAKHNMKKQKGDMITLFLLALLSSLLLFTSISVLTGMDKVMDDAFQKCSGAEVILVTGESEEEAAAAEKAFREQEITDFEERDVLFMYADYRNSDDSEWGSNEFFAGRYEETQRLQGFSFPEGLSANDIILPYQMKSKFPEGDTIQLKIGENIYDFHVAGYVEDPYYSVILNINIYYTYMSDEMIQKIREEKPDDTRMYVQHMGKWPKGYFDHSSTVDMEKKVTDVFKNEISPFLEEHPEYANYMALNWDTMRGGGEIVPLLVMAILCMVSVVMLVITFLIISFSVKNFIQRNMKNTGILQASGYTVREIRLATLTEIGLVSGLGILFGILLGILGSGLMGNMVSSMIGLRWNRPVDVAAALLTGIGVFALILFFTLLISRKYKKITVLDALRGGVANHNFKKNRFTFEKTRLPIPGVMALKETFGNPGRSLALVVIVTILSVFSAMGFGLRETFGKDEEKMTQVFAFENATAVVVCKTDISEELRQLDIVKNVVAFYSFEPEVTAGDKVQTLYTCAYEDMHARKYLNLVEGRVPEHENEAMITPGVADDLNVGIGDTITLTYGTRSADFIITGMEQKMERMGRLITVTYEGGARVMPGTDDITYYVDGVVREDYEGMKAALEALNQKICPDENWTISDLGKMVKESADSIMTAMRAVCIVLLVITILIVIFTESLVIRSRVIREWRNMGVSRAVGMTYRQLLSQIMFSNLPAVLFGGLLGIIAVSLLGEKMVVFMLSMFGYRSIDFGVPVVYYIVSVLIIAGVAVLSAAISGRRIKKIQPVQLITEE